MMPAYKYRKYRKKIQKEWNEEFLEFKCFWWLKPSYQAILVLERHQFNMRENFLQESYDHIKNHKKLNSLFIMGLLHIFKICGEVPLRWNYDKIITLQTLRIIFTAF